MIRPLKATVSLAAAVVSAVRRHGLVGAVRRVPRAAASRVHVHRRQLRDWQYDRSQGVLTAGIVYPSDYPVTAMGTKHARNYQGIDPSCFRELVSHLSPESSDWLFLDLGAGRGRALILASRAGFRRVIGVELSGSLADDARRNCSLLSLSPQPEVVTGDAACFAIPAEAVFIFLYNPFYEEVMRAVARNISSRNAQSAEPLLIGYVGPKSMRERTEMIIEGISSVERAAQGKEWSLFRRVSG